MTETTELRKRRTTTTTKPSNETKVQDNKPSKSQATTIIKPSKSSTSLTTTRATNSITRSTTWKHYILLYIILCCLRITITHLFIHSYFDPDEYWQTLEPSYCIVYGTKSNYSNSTSSTSDTTTTTTRQYACDGITWEWTVRNATQSVVSTINDTTATTTSNGFLQSLLHKYVPSTSYIAIGPIRTHFGLLLTILYYTFIKYIHYDTSTYMISHGPKILHILCITVPIDLCTYYLVEKVYPTIRATATYNQRQQQYLQYTYLFITCTSWFVSYAFVRTFANTYETLLLLLSVILVSNQLFISADTKRSVQLQNKNRASSDAQLEKVQHENHTLKSLLTNIYECFVFILGGWSIAIRITAIASFVPLGVVLAIHKAIKYRSHILQKIIIFVQYLFYPCAFYGIIGIGITCLCDWYFNGFLSVPLLSNFYFNMIMNYASLYGSHPFYYWYFIHGCATISGLCYPLILYAAWYDCHYWYKYYLNSLVPQEKRNDKYDVMVVEQYNRFIVWTFILPYLFIVSFNDHKEFRYISPVLPFIFILCTPHLYQLFVFMNNNNNTGTITTMTTTKMLPNRNKRTTTIPLFLFITIWMIANGIALAYLGLFHQSGPITVNNTIVRLSKAKVINTIHNTDGTSTQTVFPSASQTYNQRITQSIHYLTGSCHATPLQSYLHIPSIITMNATTTTTTTTIMEFDTWHMNCHPSCRIEAKRTNGTVLCETDQFDKNPLSFLQQVYCINNSSHLLNSSNNSKSCYRTPPDYFVTFSKYMTSEMYDLLQKEPFYLHYIDKYPFQLRGVQIQLPIPPFLFGSSTGSHHTYNIAIGDGYRSIHDEDGAISLEKTLLEEEQYNHEQMIQYGYQTLFHDSIQWNWDAVILLGRQLPRSKFAQK